MQRPVLRVEKVQPDSGVPLGRCFELDPGETLVGRDPRSGLVLADPRVSRQHARLVCGEGGERVEIEGLSRHAVLVNGAPIAGTVALVAHDWVQLGGVLLRYFPSSATLTAEPMTVDGPLTPPSATSPALTIALSTAEAAFAGVPLRLQPAPFVALTVLARHASTWVTPEALAAALWPDGDGNDAYVNKYISYVRAALVEAASDPALAALIRDNVRACADPWTELDRADGPIDEVVREFVKGRKKVGFRLHLRPDDVRVR